MRRFQLIASSLVLAAACTGDISSTGDDDGSGSDEPVTCEQERSYTGFGGNKLESDRPTIDPGSDRLRLKPFGALGTEYARALGLATLNTAAYAATFGRPPARWYQEPAASANTIYAAFALAFDGCLQHTATDAAYAAAPTPQTAATVCRDLAARAWHREATDDEVTACATYAATQTDPAHEPRKRWSYACAAVLSASGFLAY